jgi:chemotaxis family two-component system response regulator Rcp1
MPHYYFDLTDGVTQRDRNGMDCADDAAAVRKASLIANEVAAANGDNGRGDLHISIKRADGQEVSRVMVPTIAGPAATGSHRRQSPRAVETDHRHKDQPHVEILLVEDRPGDIRLTKEAFHHVGKPLRLHHAWDGIEAMEFLNRGGPFGDAPRPDLILLDLNIPEMDGREVLARIKSDPHLLAIPTIILTASDSEADILICYRLNANCYLHKPANWDDFDYLATSIDRFWLSKGKMQLRRKPVSAPA